MFGKDLVDYVKKLHAHFINHPEVIDDVDYYEKTREEKM